jgi:hypothetical protein
MPPPAPEPDVKQSHVSQRRSDLGTTGDDCPGWAMWPDSRTGKKLRCSGGLPHGRAEGPLGNPAPDPSISGVVSGSASACSVPARGRCSRPIADRRLGRWMMSRLAGFYIAKAMESVAGGTTAAAASRRLTMRERDHAAPNAVRTHGRGPSTSHRVAAAMHRFIGGLGRASRGRHRLGHLRLPPPESARQPSAH